MGPLFSSPICESHLTALIQEIFLVAQNSDDLQMKHIAAWAVSFLRNFLWSKELLDVDNGIQTDVANSKTVSRGFSNDSLVMKLSLWLMHLHYSAVCLASLCDTIYDAYLQFNLSVCCLYLEKRCTNLFPLCLDCAF